MLGLALLLTRPVLVGAVGVERVVHRNLRLIVDLLGSPTPTRLLVLDQWVFDGLLLEAD